jgi:uncharacterized RDD family membrane protein YckC
MSDIAPGWYKDPADPTTQRYWDGEGYLGEPIPADATPPDGPPPVPAPVPAAPPAPAAADGPPVPDTFTVSAGTLTSPPPPASTAGDASAPAWPPAYPPGYPPPGYRPRRAMPPPRPHGFLLAGAGRRLAARAIDIAAVLGLCAIANAWFAYQWWQAYLPYLRDALRAQLNGASLPEPPSSVFSLIVMMCLVATAVWFSYEVPGSANTGQTLGKRLVGIKVMRIESGDRLGFGRAFTRWGRLGLPTMFWWCWGVGFLLQALDCLFVLIDRPLRQALHDKAAGTVVVHIGRAPSAGPVSETPSGGTHADPR